MNVPVHQILLPFLTLHVVAMFIFPTVPKSIPCCVDIFEAGIMGRPGSWKQNTSHQPSGVRSPVANNVSDVLLHRKPPTCFSTANRTMEITVQPPHAHSVNPP